MKINSLQVAKFHITRPRHRVVLFARLARARPNTKRDSDACLFRNTRRAVADDAYLDNNKLGVE